jgi:7-keto-8-aminopelargonate synthetase-like enzyme
VSFASYDYLGLSQDPEVHEALQKAVERYGISATAASVNAGQSHYHEELEHYLARMLRKEDCFLFASGFSANVGALTSLLGVNDLAVADFLCHASLQDGLGAVKSRVRHFRHNDNEHFARILEENRAQHAGALAITEGLFSMDGDIPDLKTFTRIARELGARTLIDEVHSFGIFGAEGQGAAEQQGVLDDFDLYTGSLSKVPGTGGGFIVGSKAAIGWMRFYARSGMFSTALSPCFAAASLKSIEIIRRDGSRRKKLRENIRHFREGLETLGIPLVSHPESPIVPVIIPDSEALFRAHQWLLSQGVFVNLITYPAVALREGRLRFSLTANHSYADIELALMALRNGGIHERRSASE